MPLVLFVGFPSSGKTGWATALKKKLEEKIGGLQRGDAGANLKVILHNDESLGITHSTYKESVTEKKARSEQMSAVKRDLSLENVVILDGLNYIKGFRYQLYCEAKNLGTTYCEVQVIAPTESCFEWNAARSQGDRWDEQVLKELIMRFEEPDGRNRWDSPLVPVSSDDKEFPFEDVWGAIALKKAPRPNYSTFLKPATSTDYLQQLDRQTTSVIDQVVEYQNLNTVGGRVHIRDNNTGVAYRLELPARSVSISQLQRLRRTYVALNRMRTISPERITALFTEFLNHALQAE